MLDWENDKDSYRTKFHKYADRQFTKDFPIPALQTKYGPLQRETGAGYKK
jgi:hypothetical protein